MGAEDEQVKTGGPTDARFTWISDRTCSSLKVKDDVFQKLLVSESRYRQDHAIRRSLHRSPPAANTTSSCTLPLTYSTLPDIAGVS